MRSHNHESDERSVRPKSARIEAPMDARVVQAAATGHSEVIDEAGMLGLQRALGNAGVGAILDEERSPVHGVIASGGGRPLDADVRADMEGRLGSDFTEVRVHDDSAAHESAKGVNAHAYTVGSNIVFQRDKYDPSSVDGRTMLAHELTHVVQQRSGPVDGSPAAGGIRVSDPADRFEREAAANAERVMAAPAASAAPAVQRDEASGKAATVQREEAPADEEETAQGTFVQREGEEEEEAPA